MATADPAATRSLGIIDTPFLPEVEVLLASLRFSTHHGADPVPNSTRYPMIPYFPDIPAGDKVEHAPAIPLANQ